MDKKYYLIYFDPTRGRRVFLDRLAKLGDRVFMDDTLYIVKSELTALEIYEHFVAPPLDDGKLELFITEINPANGNTFGSWGVDFWRFLGLYSDEPAADNKEPQNKNEDSQNA